MRPLRWLVAGIAIGFVAAHLINRNPKGRAFFERVNRGAEEFQRAFQTGYHQGEQMPVHRSRAADLGDEVEAALRSMSSDS